MDRRPRLVFFGNERLVSGLATTDAPILRGLIARGYDIVAIVAHHSDGRPSRSKRRLEIAEIAHEHGIPLLLPNKPGDVADELRNLQADAGILVAYGRIIGQSVIDIFPRGIINIHPSLLPRWRGPTPIEAAILAGDTITGVSIMKLSAGMDEGDIYAQNSIALTDNETKFDVYEVLASSGAQLLFESLPAILDGSNRGVPQDDTVATYSKLFTEADSRLPVETASATDCARRVRAHLTYPKSKLTLHDVDCIVLAAHTSADDGLLSVRCADGAYLAIDSVQTPNGRKMTAEAFLRGYAR